MHSVVNGNKPSKPKDLGWDYQKDKEAKRVFERKKELQKLKEKKKRGSLDNVLSVDILNIQDHVHVNYVERKDMNLRIVPSQNHLRKYLNKQWSFALNVWYLICQEDAYVNYARQ